MSLPASDRDDFHLREFPSQRSCGLQAILIRHENVHNDDVGWRQTDTAEGPLFHESIDGFAVRRQRQK
jgi:hypothetical protein